MTEKNRKFVEALFNMETGLKAIYVSKIGFSLYVIEASDGNTYHFKS